MLRRIIPDLSFIFDAIVILLSDYIFFLPRSNIFIEGKLWKVSFFFPFFWQHTNLNGQCKWASSNTGSS